MLFLSFFPTPLEVVQSVSCISSFICLLSLSLIEEAPRRMHRPSVDNDQKHNKGPQRGSEMEKEEMRCLG